MKKAAILIAVTFGVAFFLFFPWKIEHYEDGGTVTYNSLTYKICVWNSLSGKRAISEIYYFPENFRNLTELNDMETLDEKEEAHVMAEDSDGYYALCRLIVATYGYVEEEDCFVSDSGPRLHNLIFDGDTEELPVIRWSEDFSLIIPHEVELGSITVLNEKGEKELGLDSESPDGKYFSELPVGTYYVAVAFLMGFSIFHGGMYLSGVPKAEKVRYVTVSYPDMFVNLTEGIFFLENLPEA